MTLKKFALRGMIVLAAVIALCVLFSGTFRTLTTPKVSLEHAKNGKMESVERVRGQKKALNTQTLSRWDFLITQS